MSLAASYSIAAIFSAKDKLSPAIARIEKRYGKFAGKVGRVVGRMNKGLNKALKIGATAALAAVITMTTLATKEFIAFDQAVVGANARFKDFVAGSVESEQTLQALKDAAREVGAQTQFSATQAAEGLNFYAKAGFTSAEAMAVLADTVDLATVAEAEFNRTADISSDLLGALGKNAQNSATKIQNLKDINRALGITANSANVDLEDLFETLKVAAPIATEAGEKMNELFAITGALGGAGIKGSMAATALKNAYIRLAKPTTEVTKALAELGLKQADFIDGQGDMKSMVEIMGMLGRAGEDLGGAERLGIFGAIFGKNAVAGATNLAKSLSEVEFIMAKLESDTKLKDLADEIRKGLGMQILILKSGLIELGFQFVESFEKEGRGALQSIIELVQNFDMKPITDAVTNTIKAIKTMNSLVQKIGGWSTIIKIIFGMAVALKVVVAIMTIMNLVMMASPVTLIILGIMAAIALLTAAVIIIRKNWDKIVVTLKAVWTEFSKVKGIVFSMLGPIGWMINLVIDLITRFGEIKDAFQTGGIVAGLLKIGQVIFESLISPFTQFLDLIRKVLPGNKPEELAERQEESREERQERRNRGRLRLAPNAQEEESRQEQAISGSRGRGTITVKSEDGTPLEVDNGTMAETGWDMQDLGKEAS